MFLKKWDNEYISSLMKASIVGIHLVTATFVGLAIGYFLDKWLGTKPIMTIIFLLFGIAAGYKNMYMEIKGIHGIANTKRKNKKNR
ncbi:AtpZ/AtpI family protein [Desulfothermus naphthae]